MTRAAVALIVVAGLAQATVAEAGPLAPDSPPASAHSKKKSGSTTAKFVAATGLGLAVIAGYTVFRLREYGAIPRYEGLLASPSGGAKDASGRVLQSTDCGTASPVPTDQHAGDFTDACRAHQRARVAGLVTFGAAAIGVGALIYLVATRPHEPKDSATGPRAKKSKLVIAPLVTERSAGALLSLDW